MAIGFSLGGIATGMIFSPHLVPFLLEQYGFRGAILIFGGFSLHAVVGACLYQPAKWYFVPGIQEQKVNGHTIAESGENAENTLCQLRTGVNSTHHINKIPDNRVCSKEEGPYTRKVSSISLPSNRQLLSTSKISDVSRVDLTGASSYFFLEDAGETHPTNKTKEQSRLNRNVTFSSAPALESAQALIHNVQLDQNDPEQVSDITSPTESSKEMVCVTSTPKATIWIKIVRFFDLDLLKDPLYLNLIVGLSLFYVAEQNFIMILPFTLQNSGFGNSDIAFFISLQAISDIVSRIIIPPICDKIPLTKRTMFMISIAILGVSRSAMVEQSKPINIMLCLGVSGFFRGCSFTNYYITISEYTTLEKLPAALGLNMVSKGLACIIFGPTLGYIRDSTRSYQLCVHAQSSLFFVSCILWIIEYIVVWTKSRSKSYKSVIR